MNNPQTEENDPLIGHTFGEWTVISKIQQTKKYLCKCSCGTERPYPKYDIIHERSYHCGCKRYDLTSPYHSSRLPDYRNKRFGRLTAIDFVPIDGEHKWLCKCDCGNTVYATTYLLRIGNVQSCGCRKIEASQFNAKKARANNGVAYGTDVDKIKKASTTIKGRGESGYRGVYLSGNDSKKYRARITFRGKKYDMGCFERLEDAVEARKKAEEKLYGEFLSWYDEEGKEKKQSEIERKNAEVREEAHDFFVNSNKDEVREKYATTSTNPA